jgi:hypothetical protein
MSERKKCRRIYYQQQLRQALDVGAGHPGPMIGSSPLRVPPARGCQSVTKAAGAPEGEAAQDGTSVNGATAGS